MKIYDCFTFYNEFELLELRLELLYNYVDFFVIVESNKTFQNKDKPFYLDDKIDLFEKYLPKIRRVKVVDEIEYNGDGDWSIEFYQRNCIARGLYDAEADDMIMVSDIDEIPTPSVINNVLTKKVTILKCNGKSFLELLKCAPLRLLINNVHVRDILDDMPVVFRQKMSYYFVNYKCNQIWNGTIVVKFKNFTTPQKLRRRRWTLPVVENAGWHFSYLGGVKRIRKKLSAIVRERLDVTNYDLIDDDYITKCLNEGKDLYGREDHKYELIDEDEIDIPNIKEFIIKYPYLYKKKA